MSRTAIDFLFATFLCVGSIFLWFVADGFRGSPRFAEVNTDFWPKIIMVTAALLTGCIAVQNGLAWLRERQEKVTEGELVHIPRDKMMRMGGMILLVLLYFIAFNVIGFLISTILFLWIASFTIPGGRVRTKIIFAPVFTIALTLIFSRALGLPLPRGEGVFYQFNLMLY